jgi:hypothetical protein
MEMASKEIMGSPIDRAIGRCGDYLAMVLSAVRADLAAAISPMRRMRRSVRGSHDVAGDALSLLRHFVRVLVGSASIAVFTVLVIERIVMSHDGRAAVTC